MNKRTDSLRTVPTKVAALAVGVAPATIRKWASRGKIKRYGPPGRPEYSIEELLRIVVQRTEPTVGGQSVVREQPSCDRDDQTRQRPD